MRRDELICHQALISQEIFLIHLQSLPIGVSLLFLSAFCPRVVDYSSWK